MHVSEAIGLLIAALGLTVMVGWLLQIPALVQISPSFIAMVFNTALCFALIGIGLTVRSTAIRRVIAVCVALFATLIWLQDVLRVDLRLDELFVRGFLPDPNAFPGRMAPQTCICFVLCSLALFALTLPYRRGLALAMQALTVVVGVAGLLSLIGYSLQLELIYGWYRYTRMAVHTAAGFAVLAAGMWFAWYRAAARAGVFARREDERISLMGGALLIIVAVTAGVSGFALLARHTERIAMQALSLELDGQLRTLRLVLMERRDDVGALARNPVLRASLTSSAPDRVQLEQWVRSSVVGTTTFLAVYSPEGLLLVRAGDTWNAPSVALPLSGNAQLLWRYGARVRIRSPIVDSRGGRIGELEAEVAVPLIAELIRSTASVSRSADLRICGPRGADSLQCLPTRLDPRPAMSAPRFIRGIELPTSLALRGERGARVFLNYRERPSVGAYARLDDEQLALVVQQETDDMYAAIRSPLQVLLVLLVGLVVAAMLLLRWQIAPLVRRTFAAKAEAAANAARLTAIMNSVPDGIISIDTRGLIAQVNPAVNALFGYSAEELLGQPIKLLIPHALAGANAAAFARFVESGDRAIVGCEAFEAQGVRKDGTQFVMQISLSEMTVEGSSFAVGVLRDITERKASERVKDEFISVVSHELRTPLTSISGSLGLVAAGVGGQLPPKANRLVQIASQNSERLTRLINDILDLEKANGGKLEIKIAEYPLRALVEQVVETNQPYAHRLGVELLVEPDSADGRVIVDRDRFVQVLTNIVSNAAKFSPAGEAVRVRVVALTGGAMRVDVSDRGSGIPESFRPRLFEKFAQADSSDTRAKGGTGLGLSIAKSLIESMGGSIGYESSSSGTTFHLTVPGVPGATLHENVA